MTTDLIYSVLTILGGLAALNGGMVWILKHLIARSQADFQRMLDKHLEDARARDTSQDKRIEGLESQIQQMTRELPETYMRRDDYVQSFGRVEQKIDSIWQYLRDNLMRPRAAGDK